jgi:hypothetical protein
MNAIRAQQGINRAGRTQIALAGLLLAATFAASAAAAQEPATQEPATHESKPHHLSAVIGGTIVAEADETAFTLGLDYEYRLNRTLGLGFVAEHAFGAIDSTTLLAVADLHITEGLAIQTGPGVEFVDDETFFVTRLGLVYEFELGEAFTLSPQLHYDFSSGEDGIVFGIAIGRAF